jgi:HEAT repeat protein
VRPSSLDDERDTAGAATELAAALGVLDEDTIAHQLVALLAQDSAHRLWAARLARRLTRPETTGVLVALSQDPESAVRAAAAAGLAFLVAAERGGAIAVDGFQRCLRDPGTAVPASVVATLAKTPTRSPVADEALTRLCGHASAYVRATAASAVGHGDPAA